MTTSDLESILAVLQDNWIKFPIEKRIEVESTFGIDLNPEFQPIIDSIQAVLVDSGSRSRVCKITMGLWVGYLSVISTQRFIATMWLLTESIPGFIDKFTNYCSRCPQEHAKYAMNRLAQICKRSIYSEAIKPETIAAEILAG
jgi:hypothetical protein